MSVEDINMIIDIQDGTTGKNRIVVDYNEFAHEMFDHNKSDISIETNVTLGEYLVYREIRRALLDDKHDIFIKIGYKS